MPSKEFLGYLSILIVCMSYAPYVRSVIKQYTKPHLFSWIIWGLLTTIAFFAQISRGAGPGAWATACVAGACFMIAGMAVVWGEKNIKRSDWLGFIGALTAIPLWYLTQNPLYAVILIIFIDSIGGYYPTFRKSYLKPWEEMIFTYVIGIIQIVVSLLALEHYSAVTMLYPLFIVFANSALVLMIIWRRYVVSDMANSSGG